MSSSASSPATSSGGSVGRRRVRTAPHSSWGRAIIAGLAASAVVAVVLLAFLWPTAVSKAKDVDVDVVASQDAYDQFTEKAQEAAQKQGIDLPYVFHRVDSRDDAVTDIKQRDAFGGIVLPASATDRTEVLTAKAANVQIATTLSQTVGKIVSGQALAAMQQAQQQAQQAPQPQDPTQAQQAQQAQQQAQQQLMSQTALALAGPKVTDVVPLSDDDAQGTGLSVAALPLTIGGIVGGSLLSSLLKGSWRRLLGVVVYAVVGGIVMVLLLDNFFGFAPAPTLELWGAVTLSLAGTVALIVGLHSVIGPAGIGIGALITMLIGNPISGAQSPSNFLPWHWGTIGQYLVPGATSTLVRDLSYFPDASMLRAWLVLAGWVVLGLVLILVGHRRTGGHTHTRRPVEDGEAAAA